MNYPSRFRVFRGLSDICEERFAPRRKARQGSKGKMVSQSSTLQLVIWAWALGILSEGRSSCDAAAWTP